MRQGARFRFACVAGAARAGGAGWPWAVDAAVRQAHDAKAVKNSQQLCALLTESFESAAPHSRPQQSVPPTSARNAHQSIRFASRKSAAPSYTAADAFKETHKGSPLATSKPLMLSHRHAAHRWPKPVLWIRAAIQALWRHHPARLSSAASGHAHACSPAGGSAPGALIHGLPAVLLSIPTGPTARPAQLAESIR